MSTSFKISTFSSRENCRCLTPWSMAEN
jgi:hypothetical protein